MLKNPGIKDFRDPKVFWYETGKKWLMALAVLDHIRFYSSPDLKNWTLESEFGKNLGAHGGVWECPDLFQLKNGNDSAWVLLVSINPGGHNGGSATQYFIGEFDGKNFTTQQGDTRWLDWGPDNYAGVTWSNTGNRKIFLGWMGNWQYAQLVPTGPWRSSMTVPRELALVNHNGNLMVKSFPVNKLENIIIYKHEVKNIDGRSFKVDSLTEEKMATMRVDFSATSIQDYRIIFSNGQNEQVVFGYEKATDSFFIDRSKSGSINFEKTFSNKSTSKRQLNKAAHELSIIADVASIEVFADGGTTLMTSIHFPGKPFTSVKIESPQSFPLANLRVSTFRSIWKN